MIDKAIRLYGIVAGGGYLGSEIIFSLISAGIKAGRFIDTVEHLKNFPRCIRRAP